MTFSIVARCADTGQLGIGIASHVLAVGRVALYIEPAVGAVATQSLVLMSHGSRVLASLQEGLLPETALQRSLDLDDESAVRQVGVVDASGNTAAFTGESCIAHAGHHTGEGYSIQTNMAADSGIPRTMGLAFEGSSGPLASRLIVALDAGEELGGDTRGRQSAAVVVVGPEPTGDPLTERTVDVRVDDHPHPLPELRRLTALALANHSLDVADGLLASGDTAGAATSYAAAVEAAPEYTEFRFWQAVSLAGSGDLEGARKAWAAIERGAERRRWEDLLSRVIAAGLVGPEVGEVLDAS